MCTQDIATDDVATRHRFGIGGGLTASPLPHHRTNGSRIRRFGRVSQGTAKIHATPQPERPLLPHQPRFHPIKALARRMPYRSSLAIDDPSPLLPSRGTVRAFSGSRHLLRPLQTSAVRSTRLSPRPVGVGQLTSANSPADLPG